MENNFDNLTPGVKFLLCLKNQDRATTIIPEIYIPEKLKAPIIDQQELDELRESLNTDLNLEENYEITDEDYDKNLREMDELIKDIFKTKQRLNIQKMAEIIKTDQDFLNYIQKGDSISVKYSDPAPTVTETYKGLSGSLVNKESALEYENIESLLNKQKIKINNVTSNISSEGEERLVYSDTYSKAFDLTDEINQFDSHLESMLNDIDNVIKLGEDIDYMITNIKDV